MNQEIKWLRRLERCLKDMPEGCVLIVHNGNIQLCYDQDREAYFEEVGDIQTFPKLIQFTGLTMFCHAENQCEIRTQDTRAYCR